MELKLFDLHGAADKRGQDDDGEFVLELTVDELARVAGAAQWGSNEESPKETLIRH